MNPELQTLVDRIELLEHQSKGLRRTATFAVVIALATAALAYVNGRRPALVSPGTGQFAVIEANRIILRDSDSRVAGGMEVDKNGTARLVLGRPGASGAALLEAQANGVAHLTLKGPQGDVLATLVGSQQPALTLGNAVALDARADGTGEVVLRDTQGRTRFRAP